MPSWHDSRTRGGGPMHKKRAFRHATILTFLAAASTVACGQLANDDASGAPLDLQDDPDASDNLANSNGAADPTDPFGACVLGPTGSSMWPFVCSTGTASCTGWGSGMTCSEGICNIGPFHAVCDPPCDTTSDCPRPRTGTVEPVCQTRNHFCQLPCDESSVCPDGFTCQDPTGWGLSDSVGKIPAPFMCMQVLPSGDYFHLDGGRKF
jgi:hypothetical protein